MLLCSVWLWLTLPLVIILVLLNFKIIKFWIRVVVFHLLVVVLAFVSLPTMMRRGRHVDNLQVIARNTWFIRSLLGISYNVNDYHNMIKDKPCVIVSNHQSSIDVLGMAILFPSRVTFLAKKELLYLGVVGYALWLSGGIFINRKNAAKSKTVLNQETQEMLDRNLKVWIFPEGTRSKKVGMLPFKKGAFNMAIQAQVPVVPVVFKSYRSFYDPAKSVFRSGSCDTYVLEPIDTTGLTREDVAEFSEKVRLKMLEVYYS